MSKRLWIKSALLVLATGTVLPFWFGGCLQSTIQRILVGVVI